MKLKGNFNKKKLRRLVINIDNVILQFNKLPQLELQNSELPQLAPNPHNWEFDQKEIEKEIDRYIDTEVMLPLMDKNIPEVLLKLKEKYEIWLITSCKEEHKIIREKNLKEHGIEYDYILYVDDNKLKTIEQISPLFLIEDEPKIILELAASDIFEGSIWAPNYWNYVKVMKETHDKNNESIKYYDDWKELLVLLEKI